MRLVSYRLAGVLDSWRAGIEQDTTIIDVSAYPYTDGHHSRDEKLLSVRTLLAVQREERENILAWARQQLEAGDHGVPLDHVEVGPPVPDPDKIICLGLNYKQHAAEAQMEVPLIPTLFAKYRNSLVGPTGAIVLPQKGKFIDYEGELAVVIGERCKDVSEHEALQYVAGYTVCNDVTARDLQGQTSQWMAGKALDTFAPMGPGIVLAADIPDPQTLTLTTRVNGQVVQHENTAHMVFSVATTVAFISSLMTLEPGDIIATGTPSGVGFQRRPPLFLQNGDLVEVEIERIGTLRNPIVTQASSDRREIRTPGASSS